MPESLVFMIIAIVLITTIGGIFRQKYDTKGKAGGGDLAQIQADLEELKKNVAEMKEYLTDLYIQQHDQQLK